MRSPTLQSSAPCFLEVDVPSCQLRKEYFGGFEMKMQKIEFPLDKHAWHPSLIPGQIVLISTYNPSKEPNIAPKSWVQMVSFEPPVVMVSGTKGNTTEDNILETKCFGINVVDASLASTVYGCINWVGQERIEKTGFTLVEAAKISAPLVAECKAHLECQLHSTKEVGNGFVIFGEIVAASIWDKIRHGTPKERYELLDQIVFLEDGVFSRIDPISVVKEG